LGQTRRKGDAVAEIDLRRSGVLVWLKDTGHAVPPVSGFLLFILRSLAA